MKNFGAKLALSLVLLGSGASSYGEEESLDSFRKGQRHDEWQRRAAMHFITQFSVSGDEKVLDLGSGDGKVSAYLSIRIPEGSVLGVDIDKNSVQSAQETYNAVSFPNLSFSEVDAKTLPYDEQFDLVTALNTMHMIKDKSEAFKSIKRSMKPGGRALIQCPLGHGLGSALKTLTQSPKWESYFKDFDAGWHYSGAKEYEKLLSEAQLEIRYFQISRLDEVYESEKVFKDSLAGWLPHYQALPEEKKASFLEDLVELYTKSVPQDAEGRVHFYVDRLEVEAMYPDLQPRFHNIASEEIPSDEEGESVE